MNTRKIINDPIYGLISFPFDFIYVLIDHPYFQRLKRISQMGLSHYVYPGATHSRFSHALGALYLTVLAIKRLREKGIEISDEEFESTCIAILLHDIGHGPFSHCLESIIVEKHHENISLDFMAKLNEEFNGKLSLAISIFKGEYRKQFLHQLVSSQLDTDRLDYLMRDSYYSGVAEGVVGYNRLISMLNVVDNELVIEEKGLRSVEKFLVSRHIMYWQVYLHKTSISAEQMLRRYIIRLKNILNKNEIVSNGSLLHKVLLLQDTSSENYLSRFANLDDVDIFYDIKNAYKLNDPILNILSDGIINRKIFKVVLNDDKIESEKRTSIIRNVKDNLDISEALAESLVFEGQESSSSYKKSAQEIKILMKDGRIKVLSEFQDLTININTVTKYYMCFPVLN